MNTKWRRCLELMLEGRLNQKQIAEEIKVSQQTIINWKKDERFQDLKHKMEREALKDMTSKAVRTLGDLLDADSDTVRFYAARDILDRVGHKAVEVSQITSKTEVTVKDNPLKDLTTEDIKRLIDKGED